MISFETQGSFKNMEAFLARALTSDSTIMRVLHQCGKDGVAALASATPVESGLTAASWSYEIEKKGRGYSIYWLNSDLEDGFPVAVMLQYGHGTGTGGYVRGRNYINPAIKPIFDRIANDVWKAVTSR